MNILFLSHYFPPEGNAPATRVHALSKYWVSAGHNVTVITCAPNVPRGIVYEGYRNCWRQEEFVDGVRVIRVWTLLAANSGILKRSLNYLSYAWRVLFEKRVFTQADVIISTSPQFFCGLVGAWMAKHTRRPLILDIRDLWPESIATVGALQNRPLLRMLGSMERWMYRQAEKIVTVGAGYRDKLIERGVPENNIAIVSNGVDLKMFEHLSDRNQTRAEYGIPRETFVCGYVGTIGMACGLDTVLNAAETAMKDGAEHKLHFVFAGAGARLEELRNNAASRNLHNITFTGLLAKERIPDLLAACDVALVYLEDRPLFRSVMPSKIFEAAAAGLPIVTGVAGYAAKLVNESGAGISVTPGNAGALYDGLKELSINPDSLLQMGTSARRHLAEPYEWSKLAERYLAIIMKQAG